MAPLSISKAKSIGEGNNIKKVVESTKEAIASGKLHAKEDLSGMYKDTVKDAQKALENQGRAAIKLQESAISNNKALKLHADDTVSNPARYFNTYVQ